MKILLDTHIFLWYISGDKRISKETKSRIQDLENEVYLSVVSIWETIIKYQLGKLSLPERPEIYLPIQRERHQILSLPLEEDCVVHLAQLPLIHRDPFDRILICQSIIHNLDLMTDDAIIRKYPISIL
jgi:PIN domain nuclease of toxin-antitoxin system